MKQALMHSPQRIMISVMMHSPHRDDTGTQS
jgi:hypothetical protein